MTHVYVCLKAKGESEPLLYFSVRYNKDTEPAYIGIEVLSHYLTTDTLVQ